jgi:NADP-dependent 3-hydroxy acid dehydrogenase YdfG
MHWLTGIVYYMMRNLCFFQVKELVRHTEMTLGPVDILVNNAGTMYYTMMKNLHEEEWERQIEVNVKVCSCLHFTGYKDF